MSADSLVQLAVPYRGLQNACSISSNRTAIDTCWIGWRKQANCLARLSSSFLHQRGCHNGQEAVALCTGRDKIRGALLLLRYSLALASRCTRGRPEGSSLYVGRYKIEVVIGMHVLISRGELIRITAGFQKVFCQIIC